VRSYDVFNSVRAATPPALSAGQTLVIDIEGATLVNDGNGGLFFWSATSVAADDGQNVLKPNELGINRCRTLLLEEGEHDILFRSNRDARVSYDAVHCQWAKLCKVGGLVDSDGTPRYTPHQLRYTRGSELIAQGQRVEIVQRVLGHRDIRSTLGYAELQEAQVRAALERPTPR